MSRETGHPRVEYLVTQRHLDYYFGWLVERGSPASREMKRYVKSFLIPTLIVAAGMIFFTRQSSATTKVVSVGVVAILGFIVLPVLDRRGRLLKARDVMEHTSGDVDYHYAVEVRPDGLWVDADGTQSLHPWRTITAIDDASEYIEFGIGRSGLAIVAKDAFRNPKHLDAFRSTAQEHRRRAAS